MLGLGRTSYLADIHNMKKKKKKKIDGGRGKEGGGLNFSVVYLSSVLDFEGLRASNTLLRTKLSFKNNFSYIHFFLIYFWGVTSRLQYYLLSFVARFFGY